MNSKKAYVRYAEQRAKKSPLALDCLKAFGIGGLICALGQGFFELYTALGLEEETVRALIPVTLIFLTAVLTGLGLFDRIARHAGAGTLVPITGFANAVVSSAIDAKSEGWILGLGAKIFTIAGPVILYGTLSAALYGVLLWIGTLFGMPVPAC